MSQCKSKTKRTGEQCKKDALPGETLCTTHHAIFVAEKRAKKLAIRNHPLAVARRAKARVAGEKRRSRQQRSR